MMTASTLPEDLLVAAMKRALLPHPIAPRRDLDVAGAICDGGSSSCCFDVFWPAEERLALSVARVPRAGIGGVLRASCLQRLARGVSSLGLTPAAVVDAVRDLYGREFPDPDFDMLFAVYDRRDGRLTHAHTGRCSVRGDAPPGGSAVLAADATVWFSCGGGRDPGAQISTQAVRPDETGMEGATRTFARLSGPGSAVVGLGVKARRSPSPGGTYAMANELAEIPRLTGDVEADLARAGLPDGVGAAVALALDELLTNVVSYGFSDGRRHEILVDLSIGEGAVELRVRDDGRAFDPLSIPEPDLTLDVDQREVGGLGIHFVRTLFDEVEYRREKGWNVLRLCKAVPGEESLELPGD